MDGRTPAAGRHDAWRVGCCAALVLLAHGVVAALVDRAPLSSVGSAGRVSAAVPRIVIVRPASEPSQALPTLEVEAATPVAPARDAGAATPPPVNAPTVTAVARDAGVRYYGFSEVDTAAEPESEWNVRLETLDAARLERVAFDVWVDPRGRVVACRLLVGDAGLPADLRAAMEADLMATDLSPAVRHGARVASHRRVEIYVDGIQTSADAR